MKEIEPIKIELDEDMEGLNAFREALLEAARLSLGVPSKYLQPEDETKNQ